MKKKKETKEKKETKKEWAHLAVRPENKTRFEFLMSFLVTRENPKITQDQLLQDMMDIYEKYKTPGLNKK